MKWTVTFFAFVGLQAVILAAPTINDSTTTLAPSASTEKDEPTTAPTNVTTIKPSDNNGTTVAPTNVTTTLAPLTSTTVGPTNTTTTPAPTTTSSTTTHSPTTVPPSNQTTTPPPTTTTPRGTTTAAPTKSPTTVGPIETTPTPGHQQHFDGLSFMGGIILTVALLGMSLFSWKFYKFRAERNYRTL